MQRLLSRHAEKLYALLRIVSGAAFASHGAQKLFGVLGGKLATPLTQAWAGAVIELVCGLLLCLGLLTRPAAFLASGTMAVAYTQFHWKLRFDESFFPVVNRGELALIYCLLFFYMAARGGGPYSLDARRGR